MTGTGHASLEETTAAGTRDTATGDTLVAHFATATGKANSTNAARVPSGSGQIQSAVLDGHVVLTQQPAAKPGAQPEAPMRATSGHAVYEGAGEWLRLTVSPRVEDGELQLTADKVDVSQQSGDAFAHGNVKATWLDTNTSQSGQQARPANGAAGQAGQGNMVLGGKGPAHAISAEAQLHRATDEVTFSGHARLWQQANSVAGPVIVLDRQKQTLVSRSTDTAEPVRAILLSAGGSAASANSGPERDAAEKRAEPSVIRVRGGDLKYSDAERKAVMNAGALGTVVAETGTATSVSNEVEVFLLPPGNHAGKDGGQAQVDRLVARGHVILTSEGRRGTGEQLVYTSESEEYVLTGTAATPPRMTDPARGNVTGEALIFHSRDDSVSVEGRTTKTETTAPR
jgi:lipopolysaccharide export system protein LptA